MENRVDNSTKNVDKPPIQLATPSRRLISWLPVVLVGAGIVVLSFSLVNRYFLSADNKSNLINPVAPQILSEETSAINNLTVDIGGAVEKPGLYLLPEESRIADVLIAAGGLSAEANRMYVSKSINLAQKITDGHKVYIPFSNENINPITSGGLLSPIESETISINQGTANQLDTLSGVGPVTASKIIAGRPYVKIDELVSRKIVSRSLFEKIKARLIL